MAKWVDTAHFSSPQLGVAHLELGGDIAAALPRTCSTMVTGLRVIAWECGERIDGTWLSNDGTGCGGLERSSVLVRVFGCGWRLLTNARTALMTSQEGDTAASDARLRA